MGFFSGVRRRIKKLIPKEIRPAIPFIAAAMGPAGLASSGIFSNPALTKAIIAGGTRFATDDEADLKDVARAGVLAAAPDVIGGGLGKFADKYGAVGDGAETFNFLTKAADTARKGQQAIEGAGMLKTVGAQTATDFGIKAAELNEDALADYNRMLAEQGIADKAGRRAAIRAIYSNTGTWDMDEVDSMLDTYGYRTGGRVGYADGDMVLTDPSMVTPEQRNQIEGNKMAEEAINDILYRFYKKFPGVDASSMSIEDMVAELQAEELFGQEGLGILGLDRSMDMITPESVGRSTQRIMRGDTQYGDIGSMKEQPETE